jgi:hypothetical protein
MAKNLKLLIGNKKLVDIVWYPFFNVKIKLCVEKNILPPTQKKLHLSLKINNFFIETNFNQGN